MIIQRLGYGNYFNELRVNNNILTKKAKNLYGIERMHNEIQFYKFIKHYKVSFNILNILELNDNIVMEYLENYIPLYKSYIDIGPHILKEIYFQLNILHSTSFITINNDVFFSDLQEEFYDKILKRFEQVEPFIKNYSFIATVNGIKINSLKEILTSCYNIIKKHYSKLNKYVYNPIHGDCQFSNILINNNNNIVFIDPRGYYGSSKIFGLKEYDYAKVQFALSGYDNFDSSHYSELDISGDNINININNFDSNNTDKVLYSMVIIMWLGNSHCFIDNKIKMYISYFYSLYLGSVFIHNLKI